MNGRERIFAVIQNKELDCLPLMPITMMFAADRIGAKYGDYASDCRILAEAQIRTAEEYDFDYVSAISDPAREAADLGANIHYFDDQPPAINEANALLADKTRLAGLKPIDPSQGRRMSDRVQGVALLKERAGSDKLIEGWVEGPCAQGADLRGINRLMMDFMDDPNFVRDLFAFAIDLELKFARAQIEAGADLIGVGDAAASLVGPALYKEFVFPEEKRLVDGIHEMGGMVRLHICGKTKKHYEGMGKLGCETVDLDWMNPMDAAREVMGPDQALCGNIDPVEVVKNGTPEKVWNGLAECHRQTGPKYIVGAGCEIPRESPLENVRAITEYARSNQPVAMP
ncbi:MAG: uroporphyrinogen decarboxylase family protein [Candidatus Omnitrophica bacterium]|nr:uroporphyrinogen decarboxylase family protein [Candidatus Omnitrophota bacterium]